MISLGKQRSSCSYLRTFQKSLHYHKLRCDWKGLIRNKNISISVLFSFRNKHMKIITEVVPIALITQEMARDLGAKCQKPWAKTKICISYYIIIWQWPSRVYPRKKKIVQCLINQSICHHNNRLDWINKTVWSYKWLIMLNNIKQQLNQQISRRAK